jgi:16S rRNA (cytidine1402-2'-O)-methyltransferase
MERSGNIDMPTGLYLVATPLGNLGDLSQRAREILSRASFIAGESRKVVLRWLEILGKDQEPGWPRPGVLAYRESSRDSDASKILGLLRDGHTVALISDAGTPALSDPGWHLVDEARKEGHEVWPVPGPCAAVAALSASGFPTRRFSFEGFLPSSGRHRREALERMDKSLVPVVFYESPHRFLDSLKELAEQMPTREVFVARELTKKFEESWRGCLERAVDEWGAKTVKGEFTLVLGPREGDEDVSECLVSKESMDLVRELGLPTKQAVALLKHFYPEANKKELYRQLSQGV